VREREREREGRENGRRRDEREKETRENLARSGRGVWGERGREREREGEGEREGATERRLVCCAWWRETEGGKSTSFSKCLVNTVQ
jgi:hypothetical protein